VRVVEGRGPIVRRQQFGHNVGSDGGGKWTRKHERVERGKWEGASGVSRL
jgi:hypothetical protein